MRSRLPLQERSDRVREQMKIVINEGKCIAAGHCVTVADDMFTQNEDDGIVILLLDRVPEGRLEAARNAARRCPTGAIEIVED